MLKNIPPILSPELLKVMMEMGHGDELVLADGNFPAASTAQRLLRLDGHGMVPILEAVLQFFPLDTFVTQPVAVMTPAGDAPIQDTYRTMVGGGHLVEGVERFAFYERAKKAYAIVATGEAAHYGNIILKKGVV